MIEPVSDTVRRGRERAEQRMTDRLQFFTREVSSPAPTYEPVANVTVIGSTKGRVKAVARDARDARVAGQSPVVAKLEAHVPVGSFLVGASVFVRVLESAEDPHLVGREFRVIDRPEMGQVTAWRYPVESTS